MTLDGDVVDPQGTLSGGSKAAGNPLLLEVAEIQEIRQSLNRIENDLQTVQQQINQLQKTAQTYNQTKEQLDLCQHELNLVKGRLAKSSFEQHQQEIDELASKVGELTMKNIFTIPIGSECLSLLLHRFKNLCRRPLSNQKKLTKWRH